MKILRFTFFLCLFFFKLAQLKVQPIFLLKALNEDVIFFLFKTSLPQEITFLVYQKYLTDYLIKFLKKILTFPASCPR